MSLRKLSLTPSELARVQRARQHLDRDRIDPEWYKLAKLGHYFGWEAIQDALGDKVDIDTVNLLIKGADKVWYSRVIDIANAVYVGSGASQSKKGRSIMQKGLREYIRQARV